MPGVLRRGRGFTPVDPGPEFVALAARVWMTDPRTLSDSVEPAVGARGNARHEDYGMLSGSSAATIAAIAAFSILAEGPFDRNGINRVLNAMQAGTSLPGLVTDSRGGARHASSLAARPGRPGPRRRGRWTCQNDVGKPISPGELASRTRQGPEGALALGPIGAVGLLHRPAACGRTGDGGASCRPLDRHGHADDGGG